MKLYLKFVLYPLIFLFSITSLIAQDVLDYNNPKIYEIGGITVNGTQYLDHNVLITLSGLSVGDKINVPGEQISNAIRALWKQGLFSDISIDATKIINDVIFLEISLKELPRLSKYKFDGVKKGEEDEIRDKISLVRGRIITEDLLNNTQNAITNYYKKKGFLNTKVELYQEKDPLFTNSNVLSINVQRNHKVRIKEIVISGNDNLMPRSLKKKMKDTKERTQLNLNAPKNIWSDLKTANIPEALANINISNSLNYIDEKIFRFKLFSSSKFNQDDYENDKQKIITLYNEKGYRDAAIVSDSIFLVDDRNLQINLKIEEGNKYYFRDISFKGNSKYDNTILNRILDIKKGDTYNATLLQSRLSFDAQGNDISSLYMDDGYLFFQANAVEKSVENDSIDIEVNIYEGPQATIDNVIIKGNDKTSEHVIRRELRSLPGSKFSRADIIRSQREIANLGYFDPEKINIVPIPNPAKGTVDIEYTVAEKSSDQLELSAGWGGNTVVGSVGVSFNNFSLRNIKNIKTWDPLPSGDGQQLSFRFQSTGKAYQSINTSFTEPWLGGNRPLALSVSAYSSRQFRNPSESDDANKKLLYITGVSTGLGLRLRKPDDNFLLQGTINYQRYTLRNWYTDFILNNGNANNLSLNLTLSRYSIDQPIYPRSGSNFSLSLQITPPYSKWFSNKDYSTLAANDKYKWAEYHKWKIKAEWYLNIIDKLVLKTSAKMGLMGYFNADIGHSPFERFQIGGDGLSNYSLYGKDVYSLRGYEDNEITQTNLGHPYFAKYTIELRYPLSLNPSSTIYLLAFAEGGNSWASFKEFNPFEVNRSAGLGMRIFLPMFGTLGFDYGVGFDKSITDNTRKFWDYVGNHGKFSIILGVDPE